nr:RecName: Full=39 kDa major outer membrane protein [Aggregatibacter actinomycetemcomitans]
VKVYNQFGTKVELGVSMRIF